MLLIFSAVYGGFVLVSSFLGMMYELNFGRNIEFMILCISGYIVTNIFIKKNKRAFTDDELIYVATGSVLISLFISLIFMLALMIFDNESAVAIGNLLDKISIRVWVITFVGIFMFQSFIAYWYYYFIGRSVASSVLPDEDEDIKK